MPYITSESNRIYYEILGENNKETIVLISGLNTQMIRWELPFCEYLVHSGFRILRLDNRDCGKSIWNGNGGKKTTINSLAVFLQDPSEENVPYTLRDMAEDIRRVVSELGFKKVNVIGRSIGGVIAQILTFRYPSLVKTLTLMMSTSLNPDLPKPDPNLVGVLTRIPKDYLREKEAYIIEKISFAERLSGTKYKVNIQKERNFIIEEINRNDGHIKPFRQTIALASYVYNKSIITAIQTPTLIIHGTEDPLFHPKSAKDLEDSLPDSRLIMIEHMGHTIPEQLFEAITEDIKMFINDNAQTI